MCRNNNAYFRHAKPTFLHLRDCPVLYHQLVYTSIDSPFQCFALTTRQASPILVSVRQAQSSKEHSVILTAQRDSFYNRGKFNYHPIGKDSRWAVQRLSRYPRCAQAPSGRGCATASGHRGTPGAQSSRTWGGKPTGPT